MILHPRSVHFLVSVFAADGIARHDDNDCSASASARMQVHMRHQPGGCRQWSGSRKADRPGDTHFGIAVIFIVEVAALGGPRSFVVVIRIAKKD